MEMVKTFQEMVQQLAEDLGIEPEYENDTSGEALMRLIEDQGMTLVEVER